MSKKSTVERKTTKSSTATSTSSEKTPVSLYLAPEDADALKALAIAKNLSVNSIAVRLIKDGLNRDEYQTIIKAYQQFKDAIK